MKVGNGVIVSANAIGTTRSEFQNKYLVLKIFYFIPSFRRNLICISMLHDLLFNISFYSNKITISRNSLNICDTNLENELYILRPIELSINNSELFKVAHPRPNKCLKTSESENTYLLASQVGTY